MADVKEGKVLGHVYTSCYCEENVYKLCEEFVQRKDKETLFAVFISNKNQSIPIWAHRDDPNVPAVWDYHVILLEKTSAGTQVYDFDSTKHLEFPCNFKKYIKTCFRPHVELKDMYKHAFRVIPVEEYLQNFSSDRTHMLKNGVWSSPPPVYPPIMQPGIESNLHHFWTMEKSDKVPGEVVKSIKEFIAMFTPANWYFDFPFYCDKKKEEKTNNK